MNTNNQDKESVLSFPSASAICSSVLETTLREGAQSLLQMAIENEVAEYIDRHRHLRDESGRQLVVGNGKLPARTIQTGMGPIEIQQPRAHDRRPEQRFTSAILPRYLRRTPSIDSLVPALYLKGVSTGKIQSALETILGEDAPGLSSTNVLRLKEHWNKEREEWSQRDLSDKHYVYIWADGIYFNVRLSDDRPCVLVLVGSLSDGTKELISIVDGHRESKLSWKEVLSDLKKRGLQHAPKLAVGDGALGFWAALEEEFPSCEQQRCWVHKTANILNAMPKSVQSSAKKKIQDIYLAPTGKEAQKARKEFLKLYEKKFPKACACLEKDADQLYSFYNFPAEHWAHIRTTNPIESMFATIRHRTRQTRGSGSVQATMAMVFKLAKEAEKKWRRLRGYKQLDKLLTGVVFQDGEAVETKAA